LISYRVVEAAIISYTAHHYYHFGILIRASSNFNCIHLAANAASSTVYLQQTRIWCHRYAHIYNLLAIPIYKNKIKITTVVQLPAQAISQDFMLGGVRESIGVQTKSGSAEPGARSAPGHGKAVLGVGAGGVVPSAKGVRGFNPGKFLK
jgi:hypothetical protein